jgi:hypothetical protein
MGIATLNPFYKAWPPRCFNVPPVVVPASHRARRVKVEASCCASIDAPARDADWIRQRRPLRASGETEVRHVQAQAAVPAA